MSQSLSTPIIIENKAGASGSIAAMEVARAAPDGYTLLQSGISTHGIGPYFYETLPYAPFKDLVSIGAIAEFPIILAVNAQLPVQSVKELIALAQGKQLSFASAGTGSAPHLSGELFKTETKVSMVHVPYKGSAPAVVDVASGQVDMMFDGIPALLPHIKSGKLIAIAVTSRARSIALPQVPTVAESGLTGFETGQWQGLVVPAGTPFATAMIEMLPTGSMPSVAKLTLSSPSLATTNLLPSGLKAMPSGRLPTVTFFR
jgi:tripartite-type tricarboxylate transporter receptor subunit TctC